MGYIYRIDATRDFDQFAPRTAPFKPFKLDSKPLFSTNMVAQWEPGTQYNLGDVVAFEGKTSTDSFFFIVPV